MPAIFAGAFAFSVGFDIGITKFWDTWNKGVRRLESSWVPTVLTMYPETMAGHPS